MCHVAEPVPQVVQRNDKYEALAYTRNRSLALVVTNAIRLKGSEDVQGRNIGGWSFFDEMTANTIFISPSRVRND